MIEIKHLYKTFHLKTGDVKALDDVSLQIEDGGIYGIIGYSGAGKSTLVRCLNLLETPDSGELSIIGNEIAFEAGKVYHKNAGGRLRMNQASMNKMRRGIGMIFQHFNLLDRSTVFENIAYPLKFRGMSRQAIHDRVYELLSLVDLTEKANVYPSQLSGGQKQRVAIARALACNPKVLLSDEATSALDPDATESILELLRDLNKRLGITIVIITHEMAVIKSICRRVAVMENGKVVEEGSVYEVFSHPQEPITKKFISSASPLSKLTKMLEDNSPLLKMNPGEKLVRFNFGKDSVGEHAITSAAKLNNTEFNIVLANVDTLDDSQLGSLIGILSGTPEAIENTIRYMKDHNVEVRCFENESTLD